MSCGSCIAWAASGKEMDAGTRLAGTRLAGKEEEKRRFIQPGNAGLLVLRHQTPARAVAWDVGG